MSQRVLSSILLLTLLTPLALSQQMSVASRVSFAPPIIFNSLGSYPTGIAAGDFNNDGIQDLIVGDLALSEGTVALGNGDGTFTSWKGGCGTGDPAGVVAVGKFDGQNLDALANDTEYGVAAMCLGDGTGYFSDGTFFIANQLTTVTGFAVADFDRDHNQDLALVSDEQGFPVGQLIVYLGNGDGSFQQAKTFNTTTNPVAVATGDFNNDGNPDLVVLTNDTGDFGGYVAVLLGNGKGAFGAPHLFRIPEEHPNLGFSPPSAIAVGDFDGDKRLDVAIAISDWTASGQGYVVVLLGNGDGTLRKGQVASAGQNPLSIFVADFNGDGVPDLAVGNAPCASGCGSLGSVSVLLGKGDGAFGAPQTFGINGSFPQITVADFNGDGKPDVATANGNSSTITILLNTTPWPPKAK